MTCGRTDRHSLPMQDDSIQREDLYTAAYILAFGGSSSRSKPHLVSQPRVKRPEICVHERDRFRLALITSDGCSRQTGFRFWKEEAVGLNLMASRMNCTFLKLATLQSRPSSCPCPAIQIFASGREHIRYYREADWHARLTLSPGHLFIQRPRRDLIATGLAAIAGELSRESGTALQQERNHGLPNSCHQVKRHHLRERVTLHKA